MRKPKANHSWPRDDEHGRHEERHLVENQLKQFRAIATRYDKTARNFLAAVQLTAALIWPN